RRLSGIGQGGEAMAVPFRVRTTTGGDKGGWDGAGNIDVPGTVYASGGFAIGTPSSNIPIQAPVVVDYTAPGAAGPFFVPTGVAGAFVTLVGGGGGGGSGRRGAAGTARVGGGGGSGGA